MERGTDLRLNEILAPSSYTRTGSAFVYIATTWRNGKPTGYTSNEIGNVEIERRSATSVSAVTRNSFFVYEKGLLRSIRNKKILHIKI